MSAKLERWAHCPASAKSSYGGEGRTRGRGRVLGGETAGIVRERKKVKDLGEGGGREGLGTSQGERIVLRLVSCEVVHVKAARSAIDFR